MSKVIAVLIASILAAAAAADIDDKVAAALASDIRSDAERAREANRRPLDTLKFFGLEDDMDVLELMPGGGWYTKILAPVLAERGTLTTALGNQRVPGLNEAYGWSVGVIEGGTIDRPPGSRRMNASALDFGTAKFDIVLTFRNLHNFTESGRKAMNEATFRALRSGGRYGVVDHTRRHMESDSGENWRRMDPVQMIQEIESVGFEFVGFSNLHHRADDELRYEVGRRSVTGNTDRFTLLFRKP